MIARTSAATGRPLACALALALAACGGDAAEREASSGGGPGDASSSPGRQAAPPSCGDLASVDPDSMRTTDSGLRVLQKKEGEGRAAAAGDTAVAHYVGCLTDGTKFDASYDRNEPIRFPLGAGRVIPGWDEGVEGMKPGGVRVLRIPPELGYGTRGTPDGPIPPDATLLFRVELVDVRRGGGSGGG